MKINLKNISFSALLLAVLVGFTLTACDDDEKSYSNPTAIELDKTSLNMYVGQMIGLTATVSPSDATSTDVIWKTSNKKIVSVTDNGILTALKVGNATISVISVYGSLLASCEVTVTAEPVAVTGIKITFPTEVYLNETATLKAEVVPADATNQNVIWSSSDEKIATVDQNGVVTPVAEGEITITVTSEENSEIKTTFKIKILPPAVPVTSLTLSETEINVADNSTDPITLTATIAPEDATVKDVIWASSDEKVVTVKDGAVTIVGAGKATITATSAYDETISAKCEVTISGFSLDKKLLATTTEQLNTTATLTPTLVPQQDVAYEWTSSDEAVATVADGVVTYIGAGEATITAKVKDQEISTTCKVVVIDAETEAITKAQEVYNDRATENYFLVKLGTAADVSSCLTTSVKVNGEEKLNAPLLNKTIFADGVNVSGLSNAADAEWEVVYTFTMTNVGTNSWDDFNFEIRQFADVQSWWTVRYDNYSVGHLTNYYDYGDWGDSKPLEEHQHGMTSTLAFDHSETLNKTVVLTIKKTKTAFDVNWTSDGELKWSCKNEYIAPSK